MLGIDKVCKVCGNPGTQLHHIISRKQAPALRDCKLNFAFLCLDHHTGQNGVHGSNFELNRKLKLEFQDKLEFLFSEKYITKEGIKVTLGITREATDRLCKTLRLYKEGYLKEEVIRACMGGKLIIDKEV